MNTDAINMKPEKIQDMGILSIGVGIFYFPLSFVTIIFTIPNYYDVKPTVSIDKIARILVIITGIYIKFFMMYSYHAIIFSLIWAIKQGEKRAYSNLCASILTHIILSVCFSFYEVFVVKQSLFDLVCWLLVFAAVSFIFYQQYKLLNIM